MSTAALDRQHRWRCRFQELSPHLQPPTSKAQLPKPSTSPFPPRQKQPLTPSCFPFYISPLLNSGAFQFCILPSTSSPLFEVSGSLVPQTSSGTLSFNQEYNLDPLISTSSHHKSSPPVPPHHYPHHYSFQEHSGQNHACKNTSNHPTPTTSSIQASGLQLNTTLNQNNILSCSSCSPKLSQTGPSLSSNSTAVNMHAQAASGNLVVSVAESLGVTQGRCSSERFVLESSLMCRRQGPGPPTCDDAVICSRIEPNAFVPNTGTSTTTTKFSTYPAASNLKNVTSSSVPRNLESFNCIIGIPSAPTSVDPSVVRQTPNKCSFAETKSVILGSNKTWSKSDLCLCPLNMSDNTESKNSSEQDQNPQIELPTPKEGVLHIQEMGESLTTEEESSSFDSGQEESSDSSKKTPCHKSRKKRPGGSYAEQGSNLTPQEKNLDVIRTSEESSMPQDESHNPDSREDVMPYTKSNSRVNVGGKSKGSGCCPRRRLIDEEGYIRRAACICVNKEETQVLLVSSKDRCAYLVPGGGLEVGEDSAAAATREAWEEAGVLGHIARYLGLFESYHHSGLKKHRTAVYILIVTEEHNQFPEAGLGRSRQWFSMDEALLHLTHHRPLQSAYLQLMMMSTLEVAASS